MAPSFASVWQPRQPAALEMYRPRFASPSAAPAKSGIASATANGAHAIALSTRSKNKAPPRRGFAERARLLPLAEVVMAGGTGLVDGEDLRLDRGLVAFARDLRKLGDLGYEAVLGVLPLGRVAERGGQRPALQVLRRRREAVPRHA